MTRSGNNSRGRGRGRPNRTLVRAGAKPGRFTTGPMDPPPAFKSGWKDIRLGIGLGSTSVTITSGTIRDSLTTLGIAANSFRVLKISAWVMPGAAANQSLPRVILSLRDPVGGGTLGTREDTGLLSRAAHVHYSFSESVREIAFDSPTSGTDGVTWASIEASAAVGDVQISLSYNI